MQEYDNDPTAAWVHAVLHKIEGDLDNGRYWYRRAGIMHIEQARSLMLPIPTRSAEAKLAPVPAERVYQALSPKP